MKLRNHCGVNPTVTTIYIMKRSTKSARILVDTPVFDEKLRDLDARVYTTSSHGDTLYATLLLRKGHGKFERVMLHRFLLDVPEGKVVDHINRDTLDNRLSNLRIVEPEDNQQNRIVQKNSSTGVRGVTRRESGKYCARVRHKGKVLYYKQFDDLEEAAKSVASARRRLLPFATD